MNDVSEEQRKMMEEHGIRSETKVIYWYKEHSYEKLQHALDYAALESRRTPSKIRSG
ncbi:hypothetical protein [Bowmanella dokdonensis]|uniref:Uncharacterized protein n=1 Tax=Bowmanella dokdonensis TaxID=751969 RepID=A0A939DRL7_9ALTE|nr:hypothetical protein [Bowmanella dokdonensis]MBN7827542.1 hypothetical protein [Bowmanella dokdonensis]